MSDSDKDGLVSCLLIIVIIPAFILYVLGITLLEGYVFMKMWNWFIAEYFNVKEMTIAAGIGLCAMVSLLTSKYPTSTDEDNSKLNKQIGPICYRLVLPVIV